MKMKLTLKKRLIFYSIALVVTTILMSILTSTILIFNQTRDQNYIHLKNAINSVKSEFLDILPKIEKEYSAFVAHKKVNKVLATAFDDKDILVLKDTFTYVGSVRNHFLNFGKTSIVDDFAFYITSKDEGVSRLIIQYTKELGGLVIDGNTLFLVDDVEFLNISTVDYFAAFPSELENINTYSLVKYENANVLNFVYPLKIYGSKIGYYVLRHYLDLNLDTLDNTFGVNFNLYDVNGKMIDGVLQMNDLDLENSKFTDKTITLSDADSSKYDAILTPIKFKREIVGYISVSISQEITTAKQVQTTIALMAIGMLIVLLGIISSFIFINIISNPITELTKASEAIASGNLQQEINTSRTDELGDLARSFSYMRDSIIEKINFIEDQNQTLEQRILRKEIALKEKNTEIQGVLQTIDQGFFTILPDLTIHLTYSDQLKDIFQTEEIARKPVMELLFKNCDLKNDVLLNIKTALLNSLGKGITDFEANKHLLVKEFKKTQTDGRELYLETDWNPLLNEDKVIEKIMVTLRDVTEIRQLQIDANQQKRELEIMEELGGAPQISMGEIIESSPEVRKRSEMILQALDENSFLTTKELTTLLNVSEATIRRDLARLAELKLIRRSRGGVKALKKLSPSKESKKAPVVSTVVFALEKQKIARKAASLCKSRESVVIDGGTTTQMMIKYLADSELEVMTGSIPIMKDLLDFTRNKIVLKGGEVVRKNNLIINSDMDNKPQSFSASKVFFGAYGVDSSGVTQMDPEYIVNQKYYMDCSDQLILMVDSSKFKRKGHHQLCPLNRINTIITDNGIDDTTLKMLKAEGIKVIIAEV